MIDRIFERLGQRIGKDEAAFCQHVTGYAIWMFVFLYLSENNIDSYASTLSRGLVLFLFNLPYTFTNNYAILNPESSKDLIKRQFLLILYSSTYAQMFFYLPVNLVYTINSCGPLFVLAFDYFINQVKISTSQSIGVFFAIIGMLFVINGNLVYHYLFPSFQNHTHFQNYKLSAHNPLIQLLAALIFLTVQAGWGYAVILVKKIEKATHFHHNFVYGTMMTLFGGCIYPNTVVQPQKRLEVFLQSIFFQGIPLAFGQVLFCHALFLSEKVGITTMAAFLTIVFSYLIKIFRYQEIVNWVCLIGTVFIIFGIYQIVMKRSI